MCCCLWDNEETTWMVWPRFKTLCWAFNTFFFQYKEKQLTHTHSYLVFFRFVLVTSQVSLAPVHISCQDGEITFDSSVLLHNKLSSCTSVTLDSQFAGGIKYEVLNSVLCSPQCWTQELREKIRKFNQPICNYHVWLRMNQIIEFVLEKSTTTFFLRLYLDFVKTLT